jgi:hypothetical protein
MKILVLFWNVVKIILALFLILTVGINIVSLIGGMFTLGKGLLFDSFVMWKTIGILILVVIGTFIICKPFVWLEEKFKRSG